MKFLSPWRTRQRKRFWVGSLIFASVPVTLWTWANSPTKGPTAVGTLVLGPPAHACAAPPSTTTPGRSPSVVPPPSRSRLHPARCDPIHCTRRRSYFCRPKLLVPTLLAHNPQGHRGREAPCLSSPDTEPGLPDPNPWVRIHNDQSSPGAAAPSPSPVAGMPPSPHLP